jgi:putative transposase
MFSLSGFSGLLKHLPRREFDRAVQNHQADKHRKGFSCWQQLVAMIYAQLQGITSLRALAASFNAHPNHHYHLNCKPIARSTLADANARGNWQVFQALAEALMQQIPGKLREEGKQVLHLIDSTSITLKGPGFDEWTRATRTRHTQQGLKLHVVYSASQQAPLKCMMSPPNLNDLNYARDLQLEPGVTYVFDKGYCDYRWWWSLTQQKVYFVTRFKNKTRLEVQSTRAIARAAQGIILKDENVLLTNKNPGGGRKNPYSAALRRIEVARENKPPLVLATNDMRSAALKIAQSYKTRWQIELFFKWIKQHLKIKKFLGRSEQAVRIQILTALIAYLLVHLHAKAQGVKDRWMHLCTLSSTLFQRSKTERDRHRDWRERRAVHEILQSPLFT